MITPRRPAAQPDVAAHYDALDRFYRDVWGLHLHHGLFEAGEREVEAATARMIDHAAHLAGIGPGSRVADVGCGYGGTVRHLASARVTGFTLSEAQAAVARERDPRCDVRVRDWLENDLVDGECDAVVAIESLSHMPDKAAAFAQCARVLRPGGRLVLCDWLACAQRGWRDRALLEPICAEGRLPSMHTAAEYGEIAAAAGLRVTHFEDRSRDVSRTWTICLVRGAQRVATDPELRRFLASSHPDRVFALTLVRILAAYGARAMVYGIMVAERD